MKKTLTICILFLSCTCSISCLVLRDADISLGSNELYLPCDNEKPYAWLDLSVYLDNEVIVQTNLPLARVKASCVGIRYPLQTLIADGLGSFESLDVCINKISHEGIGFYFHRAAGYQEGAKHKLDIVREEILIPYKVRSKGRSNRVSYSAEWRK